jgi:hypothetical protein
MGQLDQLATQHAVCLAGRKVIFMRVGKPTVPSVSHTAVALCSALALPSRCLCAASAADELDSDRDGQITVKELKNALEECNIRWVGGQWQAAWLAVFAGRRGCVMMAGVQQMLAN